MNIVSPISASRFTAFLAVVWCSAVFSVVRAQDITYEHDEMVMQQFLLGETGGGKPQSDYYELFGHHSYGKTVIGTGKMVFRQLFRENTFKQISQSQDLDSAVNDRYKIELLNMADRMPKSKGGLDLALAAEQTKIENKLSVFKNSIEGLMLNGASSDAYKTWVERYNALNCCYEGIVGAYMPQGEKKESYLSLYRDIVSKNLELCEYIAYLRYQALLKQLSKAGAPLPKTQVGMLARSAHGRWKVAISACTGQTN